MWILFPVLLPATASVVVTVLTPGPALRTALAVAVATFLAILALAPAVLDGAGYTAAFWSVPSLGVSGGLKMDGLSLLFALLITGIGSVVVLYAVDYLKGDPRGTRFVATLLLFKAAMIGAVMADDIVLLFVFWELTSLASFFLVGFDHDRAGARRAALQALLVTGGGGLALLAGLILVSIAAGTTSLSGIIAARSAVLAHPAADAALLLVIVGCFTKSAQAPFHFWLPNAMAAPTPVSAYLHSATMVKLGIYLLARLNPIYHDEDLWQGTLALFGTATAVTGALLALRETDLKRVLAYTTVTALGTLTLLIGMDGALAATAAVIFLIVHALYKAALFLVAGIVDHKTGTRDISRLRGLRHSMPITAVAACLAALSMAGLPPFVGFVGKELIYEAKFGAGALGPWLLAAGFFVNVAMVAIASVISLRLFFSRRFVGPPDVRDPGWHMLTGPFLLASMGLMAGALPVLVGEFATPAVVSLVGQGPPIELKLWHGFTPVLGLSALTVLVGVAVFLAWEHLTIRLRAAEIFDTYCPSRAYEAGLTGLVVMAEKTTCLVQHGSLRGYLRTVFVVTAVAVLSTMALRDGFDLPVIGDDVLDPRVLAFLVLAAGGVATAMSRSLFGAVVSVGLVGFAAATVFLLFGAPDVAFTQFAVEILFVVILAAALSRLPIRYRDQRTARERLGDGVVAITVGAALTATLLAVLAAPFDDRLSDFFGGASVPEAHGRNVVNVILVDFRALDTLGEVAVFAIAAFAAIALLRRSHRRGRGAAPALADYTEAK